MASPTTNVEQGPQAVPNGILKKIDNFIRNALPKIDQVFAGVDQNQSISPNPNTMLPHSSTSEVTNFNDPALQSRNSQGETAPPKSSRPSPQAPMLGAMMKVLHPATSQITKAINNGKKHFNEFKKTNHEISQIPAEAQSAGMGISAWQQIKYAAEKGGVSKDLIPQKFAQFSQNISSAIKGDTGPKKIFQDLGVEISDGFGDKKSNLAIFKDVTSALQTLQSPEKKQSAIQEMFGGDDAGMSNFLSLGKSNIEENMQQALSVGIKSSEEIKKAQNFGQSVSQLSNALQGSTAGSALSGNIQNTLRVMNKGLAKAQGGATRKLTSIALPLGQMSSDIMQRMTSTSSPHTTGKITDFPGKGVTSQLSPLTPNQPIQEQVSGNIKIEFLESSAEEAPSSLLTTNDFDMNNGPQLTQSIFPI